MNKALITIATALSVSLSGYLIKEVITLRNDVVALQKDREHLEKRFSDNLMEIKHAIDRLSREER